MGNDFDSVEATLVFDTPPRKPPRILFLVSIACILIGTCVGIFGLFGIQSNLIATDIEEYAYGFLGYLLCAVFPIIFFQLFTNKHASLSKNNRNEPYDNYAGLSIQNIFKKILAFGLVAAALSVWVFLQPIAERFA